MKPLDTAESILDLARSEVKRWGGDQPTLTHAALVIALRWADEFNAAFGKDGLRDVKLLLSEGRFCGTEEELTSTLQASDDLTSVVETIHARLRADLASVTRGSPTPDEAAAREESAARADGALGATEPAGRGTSKSKASESETADPRISSRAARVLQRVEPFGGPLGRRWEAAEASAHLLRTRPVIPALVGKPGVGRSIALGMVAGHLAQLAEPITVWRLGPDTIIANPRSTVEMLLDDITIPTVIAIDDLDVIAALGSDGPDRQLLDVLLTARYHDYVRIMVVLDSHYSARIGVISQALDNAIVPLSINEYEPSVLREIVDASLPSLLDGRDLTISEAAIEAALAPAVASDDMAHPGLALARLDLACARALVANAVHVEVSHLGEATNRPLVGQQSADLAKLLAQNVRGQADAITRVAHRMALTRDKLDLRPERPNGVFLFVGPTGVGKTQLARELAVHEFGGADRLIRLDMSEYVHDWSISRIAGPAPGYVGSTEPESWLTTKVIQQPHCVVLLDEIEKAHPRVWNLFLQVFDAGRLTDGRGATADFSQAVIVMTSNLGITEAKSKAVGFGATQNSIADKERLMAVVREHMSPELLNRMDEIIVFEALPMSAIEEIAQVELAAVNARLATAGWAIEWDESVPQLIACNGYDESYGARHLQRSIEREFLSKLVDVASRRVSATAVNGQIQFTPLD